MSETKEIQVQSSKGFMTPSSVKEGMELAAWIAKSDLAPKDYKDKPQNVLIAMQMGLEVGLSPMQAIQNIAVINGRPSIWGDSMLALCQAHPAFDGIDENESDDKRGVCVVRRRGMEPQRREFSVEDAKKAGLFGKPGPWQTSTARMLKLRARAFALRDTFADALRGLSSAEEMRDVVETYAVSEEPKAPVLMPKRVEPEKEESSSSDSFIPPSLKISQAQARRFYAIAKESGKSETETRAYMKSIGIDRSVDMPVDLYEEACEWAAKKDVAAPVDSTLVEEVPQ